MNQLVTIAITRHHNGLDVGMCRMLNNGRNNVVAFESRHLQAHDATCVQQALDHLDLLIKNVGLRLALCLVLRRSLMAEGLFFAIEHHSNTIGSLIFHGRQ